MQKINTQHLKEVLKELDLPTYPEAVKRVKILLQKGKSAITHADINMGLSNNMLDSIKSVLRVKSGFTKKFAKKVEDELKSNKTSP